MNVLPTTALSGTTQPAPETDFLHLTYRADLHVVVSRWQRSVTDAEFRQGYYAMLRLAREANCPFWQLDARGHDVPAEAALQWLRNEFIPQVASRMEALVCLAYLLSPRQLPPVPPAISSPACLAFFADEGPLTAWLTQCQRRAALPQAAFRPPPLAA